MKNFIKNNQGYTGLFFLAAIAFILFGFLSFDFKKIFSTEAMNSNFSLISEVTTYLWSTFFANPLNLIWKFIIGVINDFK
jgi:hypothetical protein